MGCIQSKEEKPFVNVIALPPGTGEASTEAASKQTTSTPPKDAVAEPVAASVNPAEPNGCARKVESQNIEARKVEAQRKEPRKPDVPEEMPPPIPAAVVKKPFSAPLEIATATSGVDFSSKDSSVDSFTGVSIKHSVDRIARSQVPYINDALLKIQSTAEGIRSGSNAQAGRGSGSESTKWEEKKSNFKTCLPEELLSDVSNLSYLGSGGYSSVFKANWHSATVALKLIASRWKDFEKSAGFDANPEDEDNDKEDKNSENKLQRADSFVSGDGFGSPAMNGTPASIAITWRDLLFCVGAKSGDYLTVVILEYCDWGCLSKAISKGVFVPSLGNAAEGRLRYRAMLRTVREMLQGLDHLHRLDVVHGDIKPANVQGDVAGPIHRLDVVHSDIKPANVLLKGSRSDRRGFAVQLIDYGLSRVVSGSNAMSGSAKGTLIYMGHIVVGVQAGNLRPPWPEHLNLGQTTPQLQALYQNCIAQNPKNRPLAREAVAILNRVENELRIELKAEFKANSGDNAFSNSHSLTPGQLPPIPPQKLATGSGAAR
eukprot:gene3788-13856_t